MKQFIFVIFKPPDDHEPLAVVAAGRTDDVQHLAVKQIHLICVHSSRFIDDFKQEAFTFVFKTLGNLLPDFPQLI